MGACSSFHYLRASLSKFYIFTSFFVPDFQDDGVEEDPLGSGDDISDEDPAELFDTENVSLISFLKETLSNLLFLWLKVDL